MVQLLYIDPSEDRVEWVVAFEREGIDTLWADDVERAWKSLEENRRVGLVVLDHLAAREDPLSFARRLGALRADLRPELHLLCHRGDGAVDAATLLRGGVDGVLSKDADPGHVLARVAAAAARARRGAVLLADHRRLVAEALVDRATGFYNMRYLRLRLREEMGRAGREHRPVSLMLLAVTAPTLPDEPRAQEALMAELGRRVQQALRPYDAVCRIGRRRFGVVLTDTEPAVAYTLGRRLCATVSGPPVEVPGADGPTLRDVHFEVGLAGRSADGDGLPPNPSKLLLQAEEALPSGSGEDAR